jgi:hypothetical protein
VSRESGVDDEALRRAADEVERVAGDQRELVVVSRFHDLRRVRINGLGRVHRVLRSDSESSSLNTYEPAGSTCALTPGISNGALKVTVVFLLGNCADAVLEPMTRTARARNTTTARLTYIVCFRIIHDSCLK